MKKLLAVFAITAFLFSCSNDAGKGKFTLNGELKGTANQKIFLEELFFTNKPAEVLDTGIIKDGKFSVSAIAKEEGLYRIRVENSEMAYFFINDGENISFKGDIAKADHSGYSFSGTANASLKKTMEHIDSVGGLMSSKGQLLNTLIKSGATPGDSIVMALQGEYRMLNENFTSYCFSLPTPAKAPWFLFLLLPWPRLSPLNSFSPWQHLLVVSLSIKALKLSQNLSKNALPKRIRHNQLPLQRRPGQELAVWHRKLR